MNYKKPNLLSALILFSFSMSAQKNSVFNPHELFAQDSYTKNGNEFRSANGAPGKAYWQNRADYVLHATIDTVENTLSGMEKIHYTNNSPDALSSVWLELAQNTYREDARSNFFKETKGSRKPAKNGHTDGYHFENITIEYKGK